MKYRNKTIVLLIALLSVVLPYSTNAQEVFPDKMPSQEFLQNRNGGGTLRADGGNSGGDTPNPGGGTDRDGYQNDTNVPATDALWLVCLLSVGYGLFRRKQTVKNNIHTKY